MGASKLVEVWRPCLQRGPGAEPLEEHGFALLIVLWAIGLLALLAAQVTGAGRAETKTAAALREAAQLQASADGAVYESVWHLLDGGGDQWPTGSGTYTLQEAGGPVAVTITDERGLLDLNQVPPPLLQGLFTVLGADAATAATVSTAIGDWRNQTSPGDSGQSVPAEYRMEGRAWGPPGQEFERIDELQLVRGMTPALYQACLPYVTMALEQGPWLQYAPPVVLAAIEKAKRSAALVVEPPDTRGPIVFHVTATATGPAGARFVRQAMVRLDGTLSGPAWKYRILSWDQGAG